MEKLQKLDLINTLHMLSVTGLPVDERSDFLEFWFFTLFEEPVRVSHVEYIHFGKSDHAWFLPVMETNGPFS